MAGTDRRRHAFCAEPVTGTSAHALSRPYRAASSHWRTASLRAGSIVRSPAREAGHFLARARKRWARLTWRFTAFGDPILFEQRRQDIEKFVIGTSQNNDVVVNTAAGFPVARRCPIPGKLLDQGCTRSCRVRRTSNKSRAIFSPKWDRLMGSIDIAGRNSTCPTSTEDECNHSDTGAVTAKRKP